MRIAVSGEFLRPGQVGNIRWLHTLLSAVLPQQQLHMVLGVQYSPWTYDAWARGRIDAVDNYREGLGGFDLVIGFELEWAARRACKEWVNIHRHPFRWSNALTTWSVQASFPFEEVPLEITPPLLTRPKRGVEEVCFTAQVSSDASMLERDGPLPITPQRSIAGIWDLVKHYKRLHVVPHPCEQSGPWVAALLGLPNAVPWEGTAYEAMEEMQNMYTVTSSTGFEAPFFRCEPHFIYPPPTFSQPMDITDRALWANILRSAAKEAQ